MVMASSMRIGSWAWWTSVDCKNGKTPAARQAFLPTGFRMTQDLIALSAAKDMGSEAAKGGSVLIVVDLLVVAVVVFVVVAGTTTAILLLQ